MRIPPHITRIGAVAALASALFVSSPAIAATPTAAARPTAVQPAAVQSVAVQSAAVKSVRTICYKALPSQAHDTLDLIESGGPFPYPKDGTVFSNREGLLPKQSNGYYHEYTVITPGSPDRGARRIVAGEKKQEDYYTSDHYRSFDAVDYGC
ncbi:ribonuclease domain-containing protein [Streptomyces varsoviensis]|uniref:Ribonuclease n=1 Tax=Streptomyces varsoviensis TaxID=67373 RepID=A0ABR5J0H2_9ACTN|nr:ribonuclease [Streptomyces varsoviensis]KOG86910.1 ribonuclease [Streptomyces varsoviensis]